MIRKICHIVVSLLLLLTIVGWTINLHYCNGSLYSIGLISKATNCCKYKEQRATHKEGHSHEGQHAHCNAEKEKNSHDCQDKSVIVKIEDEYLAANMDNVTPEISQVVLLGFINNLLISESATDHDAEELPELEIPPPEIRQVLSFLQTYLL
ncbi:MAG TPA: hypothetical protein VJ455_05545 [Ignavibacteria bacterium]|nr:hypothetical protein [Ignavibacteria bacterium]